MRLGFDAAPSSASSAEQKPFNVKKTKETSKMYIFIPSLK
jgi:hypothetical protein